ncbi:MAG: acetamidase/formamidase family protein [Desulfobacterales bacterium]|nr:acetamidase/formamidase family protein [Desulfobacterales bacterium]
MRRQKRIGVIGIILVVTAIAAIVWADTSDVKGIPEVVVKKSGPHCKDDANCFNRYHPAIKPKVKAKPGQMIVFETRDALDSDLDFQSIPDDVTALDLNLVHPMTGPVYIEGAERGDVLAVTLVDIEPDDYGYTVIVPGFGFLRDKFTKPYIANWRLTRLEATSEQIPAVAIPFNGFMGSVGVLPGEPETEKILAREAQLAEAGGIALTPQPLGALPADVCGSEGTHKDKCLRTIPPRENGGNMDVKQMQVGTTLLLPVFIDGAGLFVGDVHYAQGDGEVSGTAIEMGAKVTVTVELLKGMAAFVKMPHFKGGAQLKKLAPTSFYATTGIPLKPAGEIPIYSTYIDGTKIAPLTNLSEDLAVAARNALIEIIDYMVKEKGLTPEQAYVVASVAVDLRIGQLVDVPNYIVSAVLPLDIFKK